MGFDNECIVNIQSLPGEYFCPVCRTLIYPTEALQSQCTHLFCKPCLAHTVATTQACPYDGYLVTEADSKPLMEMNKPLAEVIGKVQVHCLYYRSSCQWQGTLSDCIVHCASCAYGNSPVLCNRCGTQIMHRQVQEHAQVCPVLPSQVSQPVDSTQAQAAAATQFAGQNPYATPTAATAATAAPVATSTQAAVDQAAANQWYQQQQYYQQYPGYDSYGQYQQQPQPQPQAAPVVMRPPQTQPAVQNVPPQPPHLQPQQLQPQQTQMPHLQPLPQHPPPLQPLPAAHLQQQLPPQGQNPTPSSVSGYSSYPQSQHAPAQQPLMQMLPPQQSQGPYAPPQHILAPHGTPQQMPAQQQVHPMGPGPSGQQHGPPHLHGQALAGMPPMGLNQGTPPGASKIAFTDGTNGKIKDPLKERGFDDKASQYTPPPVRLAPERFAPPYGHSPDMPPPHGQGHTHMAYGGSARSYGDVFVRPSMGTSPQTPPDAFDPMRRRPLSPFESSFSGPGMGRSNGIHTPLHDDGLRSYPGIPLEGLLRYERERPLYDSRGGPEFGHGAPPFRGSGRREYGGTPPNRFGADYERSRPPFNFPPTEGRSGARRFGEPAGYSRYGGPGHMPPPENFGPMFSGGKASSIEHPRKRRFLVGGWCRICKIDCGTAVELDSHSQSKDHKKMAMDMILSIKQQVVSEKPKLSVEREVADGMGGSHEVELDTNPGK